MSVDDTVLGLWKALSSRDWEAVKTFLSDDCIYADMPVGPALAARGPEDIVKRLKVGLEPLASYVNHDGLLVSNGSCTAGGLVTALGAASCTVESLAVLEGGVWKIHINGAPAIVNSAFPSTLAPTTAFFVRCQA